VHRLGRFGGTSEAKVLEDVHNSVFWKGLRNSLDDLFSVALDPLGLPFCFLVIHKFILASLISIRTAHAGFLQDYTIIGEYHLTAFSPEAFRLQLRQ
jgi:hypothetical protein